jgi:uncharacterized protein
MTLEALANGLRNHPSIRGKLAIAGATGALGLHHESIGRPGDDAAILPREGGGFDLLAGEGFIPQFVAADPWFAGWCGVMVNLSDIAAMGGRAHALIDQVWAPSPAGAAPLMQGLRMAAEAYGVPIVGGHTNYGSPALGLAVTVLGSAEALITSFDAEPGDVLLAAIDMRGSYRPPFDNYCAALDTPFARLRGDLALLPELAAAGRVRAGKDISQGGIVGTALMLAECSAVAIMMDIDRIPLPADVAIERWLRTFPSFGYLLSVKPDEVDAVCAHIAARDIAVAAIGSVQAGSTVTLRAGSQSAMFWDWRNQPYIRPPLGEPAYA